MTEDENKKESEQNDKKKPGKFETLLIVMLMLISVTFLIFVAFPHDPKYLAVEFFSEFVLLIAFIISDRRSQKKKK